jgi:hypothetical protein
MPFRGPFHRLTIVLLVGAAACGRAPVTIVHARLGPRQPLAGLTIDVLPFDPDQLLDSLGAASGRRRPEFPTLQQILLHYHRPKAGATLDGPAAAWLATRDSANVLGDSLRKLNRRAPSYPAAFERYRAIYQRMLERQRSSDGGRVAIPEEDRRLAERAASAADSLRAWEGVAYAPYPAVAKALAARLGRAPMSAETDSAGNASLTLAPGLWWLVARLPDANNPFAELVWKIPVRAAAGRELVVPVFEGNYTLAWRH